MRRLIAISIGGFHRRLHSVARLLVVFWTTGPVWGQESGACETPARFTVGAPASAELGRAWSVKRAETSPTICVAFTPERRDAGQSAMVNVTEIGDTFSLAMAMDVSVSVAVKESGCSGSEKTDFAASADMSRRSVSFLVDATVLNGTLLARPIDPGRARRLAARRDRGRGRRRRDLPDGVTRIGNFGARRALPVCQKEGTGPCPPEQTTATKNTRSSPRSGPNC